MGAPSSARGGQVEPLHLGWNDLAIRYGRSRRWLQMHVPRHLRFVTGGRVTVRVDEADAWFETYRQEAPDLDAVVEQICREVGS